MILLTTSRRPTNRIRTLCHDLTRSIPNLVRINRGKLNLEGIAEKALELNADRAILLDRWKGGLGKIKLFQAGPKGLILLPPLIFVRNILLQRELKGVRCKTLHSLTITTSLENSPQVIKVAESLSSFLNVPVSTMDMTASRYDAAMHVSSGASNQIQITFVFPQAMEIGPRITISHMVWEVRE